MTSIRVQGARVHNLKNIGVELPRDRLVVLTGLSGSGKSSLAFDTIYAEGQRRYVESLSSYARQFLEMQDKPDVDQIDGLSPAISIEQKTTSKNPRSTVATVTEIYDYLRLLFARVGKAYCYRCHQPIEGRSATQIVDEILERALGGKVQILSPIVRARKGEYRQELNELRKQGFARVRIDGHIKLLEEELNLNPKVKHTIEVVIDRLNVEPESRLRLAESVELALKKSRGLVVVLFEQEEVLLSEHSACVDCGISYPEIEPRLFSFNAPQGACPKCSGLGMLYGREVVDEEAVGEICPACQGDRLRPEARSVQVGGESIVGLTSKSIQQAFEFFKELRLSGRFETIAKPILKEISGRLEFLLEVGLDYIHLDRAAGSLSGGEAQRIRLATQIGSALVGVLYVLDEPSIGLHQRDNERLIATLKKLRDLGNTVLVVEHDEETILESDYVVDMGPGAGRLGGEIVAQGTPQAILENPESLTGRYLSRALCIEIPPKRRAGIGKKLELVGASGHNLKAVDFTLPLGTLTCITGVSGSGKSSLVVDTLRPILNQAFFDSREKPLMYQSIRGLEHIDKLIDIDQSPIGRTPRSNPVTYTGVFDEIRALFASLPDAKLRHYDVGRFSFNVKGGRCEICTGAGLIKIEMNFLPDVYVTCDVCKGKRFNTETLSVRYRDKSISDVLEMTVDDAYEFFQAIPAIARKLDTLRRVGLGYVHLGQQATTLSGGEAQRVKLSKELARRSTGKTLYILDEPTTGLHFHDVKHLLEVLQYLVDQGNTVLVIEHNLDVIKVADWIVDMGPEGGDRGGQIVAQGSPERIAGVEASHTGRFLKQILSRENHDLAERELSNRDRIQTIDQIRGRRAKTERIKK
ncbi:MAG: excinuclease ABC subunit UvrA [Myxococcaceae bacterium]|nr:excinuclease ABC subunit UvrA [Myxococcaceae bacterium]MBH2006811.1 excinuclease ABC subunit UvrA [Myxococcaceae bacterium]